MGHEIFERKPLTKKEAAVRIIAAALIGTGLVVYAESNQDRPELEPQEINLPSDPYMPTRTLPDATPLPSEATIIISPSNTLPATDRTDSINFHVLAPNQTPVSAEDLNQPEPVRVPAPQFEPGPIFVIAPATPTLPSNS